jgi:hypothetical protein
MDDPIRHKAQQGKKGKENRKRESFYHDSINNLAFI